ncbi:hypothetical protein SAMN05216548_12810 [Faunimonas pinastri]|uniref:Antitoxin Xre-like helix-turn-helix domain-containing protein n=1 Tax=Faunimonas pinastri TaxID=1855383 RepID=A0A1H9QI44_9HYPH|nr:antitoxin Xre-like helix-turn-helix domain-containing protein [Faunimonas pinastri]SER59443.1 hypothetical protein SAMN05216548_12810 [Faunimonas pinastri]
MNDEAMAGMYQHLVAQRDKTRQEIRRLPPEVRRAYMRQAKQKSRQRLRETSEQGRVDLTTDDIRSALADAAIALIGSRDPAGEAVLAAAAKLAWPEHPAATANVTARIRKGKLKPRSLPQAEPFAEPDDRRRLSATAGKAAKRIARAWGLEDAQAEVLFAVPEATWRSIAQSQAVELDQESLIRISAAVGIFKALRTVFADSMADRWPSIANKNALFRDLSPVEAMMIDGLPKMLDTRRHVEAMVQGL